MKKIWSALLIGFILLSPPHAFAELLTLDQAIQEVMSQNANIRADRFHIEASKHKKKQAKSLEDPSVTFEIEKMPWKANGLSESDSLNYRIEQKIPFVGKRHTRGREAEAEASMIQNESTGHIQNVILDLKKTYYDIYRVNHLISINQSLEGSLRTFLEGAKVGLASGSIPSSTALRAKTELSLTQNQTLLLIQEKTTHMAHLKALLNRESHGESDAEIRIPDRMNLPKISKNIHELKKISQEFRPELKELRAMEKRENARLTEARQSLLPDLSVGFEYNQRLNQEDAWSTTASLNLPIFFWGKNSSAIQEARANLKATQAEHEAMEVHTNHEIEQALSAVTAYEKVLRSYEREILPQAKLTKTSAQTAYSTHQIDFMTLLDAIKTERDLQMAYYEQFSKLGMALAELERLVGSSGDSL